MYGMLNLPSVFGVIVAYRFIISRYAMYGLLICIGFSCVSLSSCGMYNLLLRSCTCLPSCVNGMP